MLPSNLHELGMIKGIGDKKLKKLGLELLEMINEYRDEKNLESPDPEKFELKLKRSSKPGTKNFTLDLFNTGKTIDEIAQKRNLTIETIESHLGYFINRGELEISRVIPRDKLERITHFYLNTSDYNLSPAKEALGEDYTWGELRLVRNYLKSTGQIKPVQEV